eukprot:m51a1_g1965 hypothetical protein (595) ;mRNA; f:1079424-1081327
MQGEVPHDRPSASMDASARTASGASEAPLLEDYFCAVCGRGDDLAVCTRCEDVYYCSSECQHIDWPTHRHTCKRRKPLFRTVNAEPPPEAAAAPEPGPEAVPAPAPPSPLAAGWAADSQTALERAVEQQAQQQHEQEQEQQDPKQLMTSSGGLVSSAPSSGSGDGEEDDVSSVGEFDETGAPLSGTGTLRRGGQRQWTRLRKMMTGVGSEAKQRIEHMNLADKARHGISNIKRSTGEAGQTLRRALNRTNASTSSTVQVPGQAQQQQQPAADKPSTPSAEALRDMAYSGALGGPPPIISAAQLTPPPDPDSKTALFGVALEVALSRSSGLCPDVPDVVVKCARYVEAHGLAEEGIFRQSGGLRDIAALRNAFQAGDNPDIDAVSDPHVVASLLKMWFRELPTAIMKARRAPSDPPAAKAADEKDRAAMPADARNAYERLVELPDSHLMVLKFLLDLLAKVDAHSAENKMSAANLTIVFSATLQCPSEVFAAALKHRDMLWRYLPAPRLCAPAAPGAQARTSPTVTAATAHAPAPAPAARVAPPRTPLRTVAPAKPLPALPGRQLPTPSPSPARTLTSPTAQQQQARPPPVDLLS